ncbi:MAG: tetratricopeptide repeat protein [Alphaproteobacteria bacterium]|nr:tetratricopeptide repeat protein [Alphaproteobacteria bacterium]MDE2013155.1 tetratricopeptide repeat protein [Alphaproteobacteria bacterium]MDE2072772.1 tetratricopeptide repeat protein [Alphaproteobacteria bacterium]
MSDIFREVEEEVRREELAKLWKKYGDFVIAAVALLILGVAGYQIWRHYDKTARERASAEYAAAEALLLSNHADQAAVAYASLAKSAPSGYALISRLENADALEASGKTDAAIAIYKAIASDNDPILSSVARLRMGWALVESKSRLEMETLLAPLTDPTSPWRFMAREVLAYSDYRNGDTKAATREFQTLAAEVEAPIGVRQRANAMATFLKAGGDVDYGTIPPPPQAAAAPAAAAPAKPAAKPSKAPQKKKKGHKKK